MSLPRTRRCRESSALARASQPQGSANRAIRRLSACSCFGFTSSVRTELPPRRQLDRGPGTELLESRGVRQARGRCPF